MNETTYTIGQAAQQLGVSTDTLRRWESEGRIHPARTLKGHRRYTDEDIDALRRSHAA